MSSFHNDRYLLGCPVWNCPDWRGSIYPPRAARESWLSYYSQMFGTVEGNTTFYGLPAHETVHHWGKRAAAGFQFCLKFPGSITHEHQLMNCGQPLSAFLDCLQILEEHSCLGPSLLQLPPGFGPQQMPTLVRFLDLLPDRFPYAVEVRNPEWFEALALQRLEQVLRERVMDRVIFDSRPLYSLPASDSSEQESQRRKPRLPVQLTATANQPMLRLIGRNRLEEIEPWLDPWCDAIAGWIQQGMRPVVFAHTPNDGLAPQFAMMLHNRLCEHLPDLHPVQEWPHQPPVQRQLF